jgi:hypothetical protein
MMTAVRATQALAPGVRLRHALQAYRAGRLSWNPVNRFRGGGVLSLQRREPMAN